MRAIGTIQAIESQPRTTKYGIRPCHYIMVSGERYQLGFGKLEVKVGDNVSFEEGDKGYGKEVVKGSMVVGGASVLASPTTGSDPVPLAVPAARPSGKQAGVFPIPALSGERAIIRQNATTQARELWQHCFKTQAGVEVSVSASEMDNIVNEIIRLARKFEAYSTGDSDMAEAKAEVKASS